MRAARSLVKFPCNPEEIGLNDVHVLPADVRPFDAEDVRAEWAAHDSVCGRRVADVTRLRDGRDGRVPAAPRFLRPKSTTPVRPSVVSSGPSTMADTRPE